MKRNWQSVRLKDVITVKHGFAFKSEYFSRDGSYIVTTPGNFYDKGGFKYVEEKRKGYDGPVPDGYVLEKGDIVIAMTEQADGLLGASAVIPKSGVFLHNQRLGLVRAIDPSRVDLKFIYYLFNTKLVRDQIRATSTGTKVRHTSPSNIGDVTCELPPFDEQVQIASILAAFDDLIENNMRRISILEQISQLTFEEWFVRFRVPGHTEQTLIDSVAGPVPPGWEFKAIETIIERIKVGKKYDQKSAQAKGDVPVLDQSASGVMGYHSDEPGVQASFENAVITFANHTCAQRLHFYPFSTIQNVLPFRPKKQSNIDIHWLYWATRGIVKINDYKGHWPEFVSKVICVPPPELTQEFGANVRDLAHLIYNLHRSNANLDAQRDLLLPKLLSGEVAVSEARTLLEAAE